MAGPILVDGVDLEKPGARIIQVIDSVHTGAPLRGGALTIPGRDGQVNVDQPFDATLLSLGAIIRGGLTEIVGFNEEYRELRRLCKPGRTVTLTKELEYSGGMEQVTATGKLQRITPNWLTPGDYKVLIEFLVLDGLWYGAEETVTTGLVDVAGDVRTHRMEISLAGAGPIVLTNTANGHQLTLTSPPGGTTVVDVEAATAINGVTDHSDKLSWTEKNPFRLEPGEQTLTITGGTASIDYRPAYL